MLEENLVNKVKNSPDFASMSEAEALEDLRKRISLYEDVYETISEKTEADFSFIKLFNLSSKVLINKVYGMTSKTTLPYLMSIHIGTRPIVLVRVVADEGQGSSSSDTEDPSSISKDAALDQAGVHLANKLGAYMRSLVENFSTHATKRRLSVVRSSDGRLNSSALCKVVTSTLPRAVQTAEIAEFGYVEQSCNYNPLDKGVLANVPIPEIAKVDPAFFAKWSAAPFVTRFPGGESYSDLVSRLEPNLIDIEQQTAPVFIISHVTALQVLYAYFAGSPVTECYKTPIPMNEVIELTPVLGGSWLERRHNLSGLTTIPELPLLQDDA